MDLNGKTVLYLGPNFFGYEKHIQAEFERRGAKVVFHADKPRKDTWFKIALRLFPKLVWPYADRVYQTWLDKQNITQCDLVFVIKGEGTSPRFLRQLRARFPSARFVLYMWDSIANVKHMDERIPVFDKVLTFDPNDHAAHPSIPYRANFYLESFAPKPTDVAGKGIFFIGTLNGDRPAVLARILARLPKDAVMNYTLYVRSQLELTLRRLRDASFKTLGQERLVSAPITAAEIFAQMQACAVVLDIEHPKQAGLTMRSFDALAAGKKLITTNRSIAAHDFYDPTRICIIDRFDPVIPEAFLAGEGNPMPPFFYTKYSIAGWLDEILA